MNERTLAGWFLIGSGLLAVAGLSAQALDVPKDPPTGAFDALYLDGWLPRGTLTGVTMELPLELRQRNYGGGSCVHASNISLLRYNRHYRAADWWRATYGGGEYSDRLIRRMEAAGLRYAYTKNGDWEFLDWCSRTRRGAGIFYKPRHSINFVGHDGRYAYLLDNNRTDRIERVPLEEFKRLWRGRYGGFAWTLIYQPPPPRPFVWKAHHEAGSRFAGGRCAAGVVAHRRRLAGHRTHCPA